MLRQLTEEEYGRPANMRLAVVHLTVEEIEEGGQLHFLTDLDDLGCLRWVPVAVPSGASFAFVKYDDALGGVEIWGDVHADLDELAVAMRAPRTMIERTRGPD